MKSFCFFSLFLITLNTFAQSGQNTTRCSEQDCILLLGSDKATLKRIVKTNTGTNNVYTPTGKNSWGYGTTENIRINFQFDYAFPFNDGYAVVVVNGLMGIIDSTGRFAVPLKYKSISMVSEGLAFFSSAGNLVDGIVDMTAKEFPLDVKAGKIDAKTGGETIINIPTDRGRLVSTAASLIPYYFSDGVAVIDNKVFDKNGKFLFTSIYTLSDSKEGMLRVCKKTSEGTWYGFMNRSGALVIPPVYLSATDFEKGRSEVSSGNPRTPLKKFIDKNGKEVK